jgi:hypothetical protein
VSLPPSGKSVMQSIVGDILRFYGEIEHGRLGWVKARLQSLGIRIISEFLENTRWMNLFYRKYVEPFRPRVVICGINPGRFGSGKAGVPFLDFRALNELVGDTGRNDTEKSARFFFDVVKHFGQKGFYSTFYVTNVSWLGFTRDGRNINYYRLPEDIQAVILERFTYEMGLVKPTHIIATSLEVAKTLHVLKDEGKITADTGLRLRHPRWCGIDRNHDAGLQEYIDVLGRFIKPAAKGQGG